MKLRMIVACAVFFAMTRLSAQNKVLSYSTTIHSGAPGSSACIAQRDLVVSLIDTFPHPAAWTWVVACDEASWRYLQSRSHRPESPDYQIMALTDLEGGNTFVRGYYLLHPLDRRDLVRADHIVAHELCHIFLHSPDEGRVAALSRQWFQDRNAVHLATSSQPSP